MLKPIRHTLIQGLWKKYRATTPQVALLEEKLRRYGVTSIILDHFAIIDLPGPHTGIPSLSQIFSALGYTTRGQDYLPDKQNDFLWMTEIDSLEAPAETVLPQVVVADFRLDELPTAIRKIIEKYTAYTVPAPFKLIQTLIEQVLRRNKEAAIVLQETLMRYFSGREWPLPTTKEFHTVQEFNELLAWVLVFGRVPNHFTLSIHLLNQFNNLNDFHCFVENEVKLSLNKDGGVIKGGPAVGIAQGSTEGNIETIKLADGNIQLPTGFVEFVWRYPCNNLSGKPQRFSDYFTGFVAQHADRVIESLFVGEPSKNVLTDIAH